MTGGPGNDILLPSLLSTMGGILNAGDGSDVVVAANFSRPPRTDIVDLDGKSNISIPLGSTCKVETHRVACPCMERSVGGA